MGIKVLFCFQSLDDFELSTTPYNAQYIWITQEMNPIYIEQFTKEFEKLYYKCIWIGKVIN